MCIRERRRIDHVLAAWPAYSTSRGISEFVRNQSKNAGIKLSELFLFGEECNSFHICSIKYGGDLEGCWESSEGILKGEYGRKFTGNGK